MKTKKVLVLLLVFLSLSGFYSVPSFAADNLLEGTVYTPDGLSYSSEGTSYVKVYLKDIVSGDIFSADVQDDGSYSFPGNVPGGCYDLCAHAYGSDNPYTNSTTTFVILEEGSTEVEDLDLTYPLVTGYILKPDGTAFIPGTDSKVSINLYSHDLDTLEVITINDDGSYKIGGLIMPDDFDLVAVPSGKSNPYAKSETVKLSLFEGITLEQDLTLTNPCIKGKVLSPDGTAITNSKWAFVDLSSADGLYNYTAVIDSDGSYEFPDFIPSGNYSLSAVVDGSDCPYSSSLKTDVSIVSGSVATKDIKLSQKSSSGKFKISGYIKPDFSFTNTALLANFKVEIAGTNLSAVTDSTGYFLISDVPSSTTAYSLKVSKPNFLSRIIGNIVVSKDIQTGSSDAPLYMWCGDMTVNGVQDGAINMTDIMAIANVFNSASGSSKYVAGCDLNQDNAINMNDIMIIAKNFNKTSANYPVTY